MGPYLTNSPVERLARYIEMAALARRSAASSKTKEARDIYLSIAQMWDTLAAEIENAPELRDDQFQPVPEGQAETVRHRGTR